LWDYQRDIKKCFRAESGEFAQNTQETGDKTAEQKEIDMLKGVIETLKSVIDVYVKKA